MLQWVILIGVIEVEKKKKTKKQQPKKKKAFCDNLNNEQRKINE